MNNFARRFGKHLENLYGWPLTRSLKFSLVVCGTLALCLFGGLIAVAVSISNFGK